MKPDIKRHERAEPITYRIFMLYGRIRVAGHANGRRVIRSAGYGLGLAASWKVYELTGASLQMRYHMVKSAYHTSVCPVSISR